MSVSEVYNLLKKFREKKCSPDELRQLNSWYEQFYGVSENIPEIPSEKLEALWCDIENRVKSAPSVSSSKKLIHYWSRVAALLILAIGIGTYFLLRQPAPEVLTVETSIQPGKKTAILKLSDGRQVVLTDMLSVQEKDGTLIRNEQSKQLDYTNIQGAEGKTLMNTIEVPLGGEYQLILADGTKVWLNSGTELTYPVSFSGKNREVTLTGEAYFQVAKSGLPFVVKTEKMDVRVLGTSFNVSDYREDKYAVMALVEGRVCVQAGAGRAEYEIRPGHVLSYEKGTDQVEIKECDTDLYTSWTNGRFRFRDMRLEDIMMKLNRWYNCEFFYQNPALKDLRFSGAAEKDRPVGYLLDMIGTVTDVQFEIKDHSVVLRQK